MDLGPFIRIIENVPAVVPLEKQPGNPAPKEPSPAKEPQPA